MTPERRAELKRLEGAATPGPWSTGGFIHRDGVTAQNVWSPPEPGARSGQMVARLALVPDAAFIAAAREAVPELLEVASEVAIMAEAVDAAIADRKAVESERDALAHQLVVLVTDKSGLSNERDALRAEVERLRLENDTLRGDNLRLKMGLHPRSRARELEARVAELEGALRDIDPGNPRRTDCNERKCGSCSTCVARAALAGKEGG